MKVEEKLISLRLGRKYSQESLAEKIGVSRQAVARWESGQAYPELPKLIALSELYNVSLDRLLKESEYDEDRFKSFAASPADTDLISFLIKAKKSTYAGKGAEITPSRPGSHDLSYEESDYLYLDTYLGGERFAGQEALWSHGVPVWSMNYSGRILDAEFSGDFLKSALLNVPEELPFRGPRLYSAGDYTYHADISGSFDWFSGKEEIFCCSRKVYECLFFGGKLS